MKVSLPSQTPDIQAHLTTPRGHSSSKAEERRRESPSGWHYYALYKDCPRKWYLKYVIGLVPEYTAPPLVFGGAIHDAVAHYYTHNFDKVSLVEFFRDELTRRRGEYESSEKFIEDLARGTFLLTEWVDAWRDHDMNEVDILEVETQYTLKIGPPEAPMTFTVRPDRVVRRHSDGAIVIPDVKTTGWSVEKSIGAARLDDQLTSYVWAWNTMHPDDMAVAAQVDVMYARGSKARMERSEDIPITRFAEQQFVLGLYGLITEISQKVEALSELPWPLLFPRNGRSCGLFGCPYEHICREQIDPNTPIWGFTKDPWVEIPSWLATAQKLSLDNVKLPQISVDNGEKEV